MANILPGLSPYIILLFAHQSVCLFGVIFFQNTVVNTDRDGGVQWKLLVLGHYTAKLGCHT